MEGNALRTKYSIEDVGLIADALAADAVACLFRRMPALRNKYGPELTERTRKDFAHHFRYFSASGSRPDDGLILDYLAWLKLLFDRIGLKDELVKLSFECMAEVSAARLSESSHREFSRRCRLAVERYGTSGDDGNRYRRSNLADPHAKAFLDALLDGRRNNAQALAHSLVAEGHSVRELYETVFQPTLRELGRLWHTGKISVAQEHFSTAATQYIMATFYDRLFSEAAPNGKTVLAACAQGELHEVGLRMVADILQSEGWDTVYLGANLPIPDLTAEVERLKPDVVALSATIAENVPWVKAAIAAIRASSHAGTGILVGGLPFLLSPELQETVGADATAPDFNGAAKAAAALAGR
jgi:methanogenic corrinoid protein MtbC1